MRQVFLRFSPHFLGALFINILVKWWLMDELQLTIMAHEGINEFAYRDSLEFWTIGCGRNIDKRCGKGISQDEVVYLLNNDIANCTKQLANKQYYINQSLVRQGTLIELVFNMGLEGLETFVRFLAAMTVNDYDDAVKELASSLWAKEVHQTRVTNICYRILNGSYPTN
jgi:lysozyme